AALFVPELYREELLALEALNIELAQIASKVSEPVLGQIRLAWWQEAIAELYSGTVWEHPVLQALTPVITHLPQEKLLTLPESYREHFPQMPPDDAIDALSLALLRAL